ncbi:MAG: hypothetical protein E7298_00680 [Lachnospiraceae bacterium]|nr:hypothetical protein [Lachnospiraceae bacterium]
MLNYDEFKDAIASQIKDFLPESYSDAAVSFSSVLKNNSLKLDGLNIRRDGESVCPTIYVNAIYNQYKDGRELEDILSEIAHIRQSHEGPLNLDVAAITDFSRIRDKLRVKLINSEQNTEYLKDKPHTEIADLSAVYYIDLGSDSCGNMTTVITDNLLSQYGVSIEELHLIAISNMGSQARFCTMFEVLSEMMPAQMFDNDFNGADNMLFILTNQNKVNGAAMLLCPDAMDMVREQIGESYYILPSSVSEILCVPFKDDLDVNSLKDIVHEVNSTQVAPDEVLSDTVYLYDYDKHCIVAAA